MTAHLLMPKSGFTDATDTSLSLRNIISNTKLDKDPGIALERFTAYYHIIIQARRAINRAKDDRLTCREAPLLIPAAASPEPNAVSPRNLLQKNLNLFPAPPRQAAGMKVQ